MLPHPVQCSDFSVGGWWRMKRREKQRQGSECSGGHVVCPLWMGEKEPPNDCSMSVYALRRSMSIETPLPNNMLAWLTSGTSYSWSWKSLFVWLALGVPCSQGYPCFSTTHVIDFQFQLLPTQCGTGANKMVRL